MVKNKETVQQFLADQSAFSLVFTNWDFPCSKMTSIKLKPAPDGNSTQLCFGEFLGDDH